MLEMNVLGRVPTT